jgi:anaerobic selenocysteine-containing dehydrogenase
MIATLENGKMIGAKADKKSGLHCDICPDAKGPFTLPEAFSHPNRLEYPMKRAGERGENRWTRISWDEALDAIAEKLNSYRDEFGPESIALVLGEPKGMEFAFGQRFGTYLQTPNVITPGNYCGVQTGTADHFTFGTMTIQSDLETEMECVVIWGANPLNTGGSFRGMRQVVLDAALRRGAKLIMMEPGKNRYCEKADYWLRLKPGSDGALAMGMAKVIIEEALFDKEYVEQHTIGFDELRQEVATFSFADVEAETWIDVETLREVSRVYATSKPAQILWGNALENSSCALQICRAVTILRALTGNVGVHGGEMIIEPAKFSRPGRFYFDRKFPRPVEKSIGKAFPIAMGSAYVPTHSLVRTILSEDPYPIKMALAHVTNPLLTYADSEATFKAFMKVPFLVVAEIFPTSFTAIADIVLPAALPHEHDTIGYWPSWFGFVKAYQQVVDPPGEAWPDAKMINELAKRVGLGEYFWDDWHECLDLMLEESGLTYKELVEKRILKPTQIFLEDRDPYFPTPSGKAEFYSQQMKQLGLSPLPTFKEVASSRFGKESFENFPLVLTNYKEGAYMLSGYRDIQAMRKKKPEAVVELHPDTAAKYGVKDGDMIFIESRKGRIQQRLKIAPYIHPQVVMAAFGWSDFDEETKQYDWRKNNLNILTDADPPHDPATGSVQFRGVPCRISPDELPKTRREKTARTVDRLHAAADAQVLEPSSIAEN